jgi:hypothetical protein
MTRAVALGVPIQTAAREIAQITCTHWMSAEVEGWWPLGRFDTMAPSGYVLSDEQISELWGRDCTRDATP